MSKAFDDNTKMPFGSKKGQPLGDISNGYFQTLYDAGKTSGAMKAYIENRIPVLRHQKEKKQKEKQTKPSRLIAANEKRDKAVEEKRNKARLGYPVDIRIDLSMKDKGQAPPDDINSLE